MTHPCSADVTWLGHSGFLIETSRGTRIAIDPWITGNPNAATDVDLSNLDFILVTHGHDDHTGDTVRLAAESGATVVAIVELCGVFAQWGVENLQEMNRGGTVQLKEVAVTMVNAFHTSSTTAPDGSTVYAGEAAGFMLRLDSGYTIYHAGDTMIFGDMELYGELWRPDLALLPIGGHYTMDPRQAAHAARLLGVTDVIGMHWGTFPVLAGTPEQVDEYLPENVAIHPLQPGASFGSAQHAVPASLM